MTIVTVVYLVNKFSVSYNLTKSYFILSYLFIRTSVYHRSDHHHHHHHHQQQQQQQHQQSSGASHSAATTTLMLLATSFLYVVFSLSNWQLINDLLYLVPLGSYVGRTCDGLLLNDAVRHRYVVVENAFSVLDSFYLLVYAYNVVVYVFTGTQFRAELRRLFHC